MTQHILKKSFSLKDHLFNTVTVSYLGDLFEKSDPRFNKKVFIATVMKKLLQLELKERIVWIATVLEDHLSKDFTKASKQILKALPEALDSSKSDDDFGSFIFAPLGEYVVRNGLTTEHVTTSLATLSELTQRFSMEDAIRYFIDAYPVETKQALHAWSTHPHYHVRRLVSEGTRPYLPWSKRINLGYVDTVPYLETLHADTTRYVTRSVANHLNDVSKKNGAVVIDVLKRWKFDTKQNPKELAWMTRHALRTLIKRGDTHALRLLGYTAKPNIQITNFTLATASQKMKPGDVLTFSFEIKARENVDLMIDYVIDFVKEKGSTKPKVFKIKKLKLTKGEETAIIKKHRLLADATTFKLYPGKHSVSLQINGMKFEAVPFIIQ